MTLPIEHKIVKVILEMDNGQIEELTGSSIVAEISTSYLPGDREEWELVAKGINPGITWRQKTDPKTMKLRDKAPKETKEPQKTWVEF